MSKVRLDSEERRRAIVDAAMPLFARSGFAGTTTKQIAKAAGVSEALVFQHFPTKAALYQASIALGCDGDPALAKLDGMEPSTATLVAMTRLLLGHFVLGEFCDEDDGDIHHRLMINSYLEDGEYARLISTWIADRVLPLYRASLEAAELSGDLLARPSHPHNAFWFGEHVAASIAYARMNGRNIIPYGGTIEEIVDDAARFILRGSGLSDEAIARYFPQGMAEQHATPELHGITSAAA